MLIDKKMKRTDLIVSAGISANILAKLGKDEFVSMESLEKICKSLDCNIGDIVALFLKTQTIRGKQNEKTEKFGI